MNAIKKLVFVSALLLSLVGGASTASADPGTGGPTTVTTTTSTGGISLTAGVTWE